MSLDLRIGAGLEPRFGYDFSGVRVHADDEAAGPPGTAARRLSAAPQMVQRTACETATRLHAERGGTTTEAPAAEPSGQDADAAWAAAGATIDFALSILENPVARIALGALPIPVGDISAESLRLLQAALPHIRDVWELISDPARLMAQVRTFVDEHLAGVPELARGWMTNVAFASIRGGRHMTAIGLALADAVAEFLQNWSAPFVTAWNEFIHPLDVSAEMADLACIQERYQADEINLFEAYTAVFGWLVDWINRYSVYVGIALIVGGAAVGALGGAGVGGAGGAAAGGAPAAPGAAAGGGGGVAAGAGSGWAASEVMGTAILGANAVRMLLQVTAAVARLAENDDLAAEDARTGRTPSDEELQRREGQYREAYGNIAGVLLGLGIMGALVLLATLGPELARVAVAALSRRYPSLEGWLATAGQRFEQSAAGRAVQEFQAGRERTRARLEGTAPERAQQESPPAPGEERAPREGEAVPGAGVVRSQVREAMDFLQHAVCGLCFAAGTLVLTEQGRRPIETLQVGDLVLACDENAPDRRGYRRVTGTFCNATDRFLDVGTGEQTIRTTPGHVWWCVDKGWIHAQDLEVGDGVLTDDGAVATVASLRVVDEPGFAYNVAVDELATYFVAADEQAPGLWVHNQSTIRVLRPDQVYQQILPTITITNRRQIRAVVGEALHPTGSYRTEVGGLLQFMRRNRGAGFQGFSGEAVNQFEAIMRRLADHSGEGVVAAVDLARVGSRVPIYDLRDPDTLRRVIGAYPRFHAKFTELSEEGVIAVGGVVPARAVQGMVHIPRDLSEVERERLVTGLMRECP